MEKNEPLWDAIMLNLEDNVATALKPLSVGDCVRIKHIENEIYINIKEEIPLCHKVSVEDIKQGDVIFKHGINIGRAVTQIPLGRHVHVHNLASERAKLKK